MQLYATSETNNFMRISRPLPATSHLSSPISFLISGYRVSAIRTYIKKKGDSAFKRNRLLTNV
ncbi:hypothetical protein Bacsa_3549 [Phocaeicola salanitronis DSM 18170]|uniref:Uncharacterized protein n=1 Tax=Phocaeicola salanitronis (strain DSM 18170 / JCM 13657 / CCUG 60908 / BL78) TaxID=667015 RepID=F0R888_PHOSB|nr:hypothetical protein Bacsa_3549 [Phocaeicola salanitronis DSM 18170]